MRWLVRRPHTVAPLADSLDLFRTRACRSVAEGYLELLQATGGIPAKRGFDVSSFARVMPDLALTAVTKPDQCILRVVGEAVKERVGGNPVGRNYYDLVHKERRAQAIRAMTMVIDVPCAFRAEIEEIYSDDRKRLSEAVGFPLISDEPGVDGFIFFGDQQMPDSPNRPVMGATLLRTIVVRRDLLDLGFGVDESFEDLVPVEDD